MTKPKQKTIQLAHGYRSFEMMEKDGRQCPEGYKVVNVTNSLAYKPGDIITAAEAAKLEAADDWTIHQKS
jgi:ribosomal protein S17